MPDCTCLEYGHGLNLTRVVTYSCPVHGSAQPRERVRDRWAAAGVAVHRQMRRDQERIAELERQLAERRDVDDLDQAQLEYTNADDGVWLVYGDQRINLGFFATVADVLRAVKELRDDV